MLKRAVAKIDVFLYLTPLLKFTIIPILSLGFIVDIDQFDH
jgi:hypothetical protein